MRDLAIQWKSYGTLVGSFNLIVYGGIIYLGEQLTGDRAYGHSRLAFFLFFVGILNSFTNYGHHTYHIPQTEWVKWIAFIVSMTEIIILFKVLWDLVTLKKLWGGHGRGPHRLAVLLLCATTLWTFLQLILSILISIPPVNTLFHGTHIIVAHSMGSMIGIDSFALMAVGAFLFQKYRQTEASPRLGVFQAWSVGFLNLGLFVLWGGLVHTGFHSGMRLYFEGILPQASQFPPYLGSVFIITGLVITLSAGILMTPWVLEALRLWRGKGRGD